MFWTRVCANLIFAGIFLFFGLNGADGADGPIIVDHECTDISKIPISWIDEARENLLIAYSHTSHGSQLVSGIEALNGWNPSLHYQSSGWGREVGVFLNNYWANDLAADLGHNGYMGWRDATVTMLDHPANDRNVVIWSWCGGVSDNTVSGIQAYLDAMDALEQSYPGVVFVYMTGHLDGGGAEGNLHQRNEQIRNYCRANGKVLFDFADIESYDPDGEDDYLAAYGTDGCEYDSDGDGNPWGDGNWAREWINANPGTDLAGEAGECDDCAHSENLNCVLKGRAFWWLMARLAGWDGGTAVNSYNYLVPAVAHASGVGDSSWRTNLIGGNLSATAAELTMTYDDGFGKGSVEQSWTLAPGATWMWTDVVDLLFAASGTGVITIDSDTPIALTARTYNLTGQDQTYGQSLPALTEEDAIPDGRVGCVLGLVENQRFRSNLGVVNIGDDTATVRIQLYETGGSAAGDAIDLFVEGREWEQIDQVLIQSGAGELHLAYAVIEVVTEDALIWAYGSVIDNTTGDPTTIAVVAQ